MLCTRDQWVFACFLAECVLRCDWTFKRQPRHVAYLPTLVIRRGHIAPLCLNFISINEILFYWTTTIIAFIKTMVIKTMD